MAKSNNYIKYKCYQNSDQDSFLISFDRNPKDIIEDENENYIWSYSVIALDWNDAMKEHYAVQGFGEYKPCN